MAGCKRSESVSSDQLYGHWDITKAEKNGKETSYLRNGYFIIQQEGTMTVNITGEEEKGTYMLEDNKVMMEGNKVFAIQSLVSDSLVMQFEPGSNSKFTFYMIKRKE